MIHGIGIESASPRVATSFFDSSRIERENRRFSASGGVSAVARPVGFRPAFRDSQTHAVYLSRFANGDPAPCHILDGLPDEVVLGRNEAGRVTAAKPTLVSGFVRDGRFYDRDEAARSVAAA